MSKIQVQNTSPTAILHDEYGSIMNLEYNWDDHGAEIISEEVFENGISFVEKYYNFLIDTLGIQIELPEINPVPNGSIDLYWELEKARMLINIKKESAKYYGDQKNNKNSIKGEVDLIEFQDFLAIWMKKLSV